MNNLPVGPLPDNCGCMYWVHAHAALHAQIADARRCLTAALEGGDESAINAARSRLDQLTRECDELGRAVADETLARLEIARRHRPAEYADHFARVDPIKDCSQRLEELEGVVADLQAGDLRGGAR